MAMAIDLSTASEWQYIGDNMVANRIFRKGRYINLDTITNKQVEALMNAEPKYWSTHFQKKEKPAKVEKKEEKPAK